jgi:hypothetical protein
MERAIKVSHGIETLVTAEEVRNEYGGIVPWGIDFLCPICRQPLEAVAMHSYNRQAPHFRHEKNNPRAQECENYVSNNGYLSTYQRVPLPMYIRKARSTRNDEFIVEGGFKFLGELKIEDMSQEGAVLKICHKNYPVSLARFGHGFIKLPFEEIALDCSSFVMLSGSSTPLSAAWGYPENASGSMVFTQDPYSKSGKRVSVGDVIPFDTYLYILVPPASGFRVKESFPNSRKAGFSGSRIGSWLEVYEARLSKEEPEWERGVAFLEKSGFRVGETQKEPKLVWPPSFLSEGNVVPLFNNSPCIFITEHESQNSGKLFVHTYNDTLTDVKSVNVQPIRYSNADFAVLKTRIRMSFITTNNWTYSALILLHPAESAELNLVDPVSYEPDIVAERNKLAVTASFPCAVQLIQHRLGYVKEKITADNNSVEIDFSKGSFVRVLLQLHASDNLIIWERANKATHRDSLSSQRDAISQLIVVDSFSTVDKKRTEARKAGKRTAIICGSDKTRALIRRNNR